MAKSKKFWRRYYIRYLQPWNTERLVDPEAEQYWLPVDLYIGKSSNCWASNQAL